MANPEKDDEEELDQLSDVYSVLKQDAKAIIYDLKGGVVMWREAAGGAAASAGFIIILILMAFRYYPPWTWPSIEGWGYVIVAGVVAAIMAVTSGIGFRKYFALMKKYSPLFERAEKMWRIWSCLLAIFGELSCTLMRLTRAAGNLRGWLSITLREMKRTCVVGSRN
jgi:hypothetical protein